MEKLCAVCKKKVDSETAAILTLGGYANAKYLCEECDSDMEIATRSRDCSEISSAMDRITKKMSDAGIDDKLSLKTVSELLSEAKERAEKIKLGEYDFAEEEENDAAVEEVPEELRETEEDKILDEKEREQNKKIDRVIGIISGIVISATFAYIAYRFISTWFL